MMPTPQNDLRFLELFERWFNNMTSEQELKELQDMYRAGIPEQLKESALKAQWSGLQQEQLYSAEQLETLAQTIFTLRPNEKPVISPATRRTHRVHFLKTAWFRYAAAIILLFGISAYLFTTQKTKPVPEKIATVQDVPAPEALRATITLDNGQIINLDSVADGALASQGNVSINKLGDGRIVYTGTDNGKMIYNTIKVPRGSQIATLLLSDGSKVYLNASSSLKYPVAFGNSQRRVEITGEAYFEIAKDAKRKFIVVSDGLETQVLGTQFNINAYPDELSTKVTLIEGKVKVSSKSKDVVIKPGQQAELTEANEIKTNENVNLASIVAWQKGVFLFSQMDLNSMLRQISRWYDVNIEYKSSVKPGEFGGGLSRRSSLSEVIKTLEGNGVPCTLKGSTLIIGK